MNIGIMDEKSPFVNSSRVPSWLQKRSRKWLLIIFMRERNERPLYLKEKILNFAYNARYKSLRFLEEYNQESFLQPGDQLHILGRSFTPNNDDIDHVQYQIYQIFNTTPWITYRAGFPELPHEQDSYISDTGWGCMVRVGQMLFAQLLKKHRNLGGKEEIKNMLHLFSDFDETQPFSIHNIARMARREYNIKPGEWYNPSQIAFILSELHDTHLSKQLSLKIKVFNSGNLFFDTILESMLLAKPKCSCKAKQGFVCVTCNSVKNSMAIIVMSRLGLNGPEKKYLAILEKMMEFSSFQGIIGGKPQKALYFLGKHKEQYVYLDPHYVQSAEKQLSETYFCESFRKCRNTSIDSSMGICFYFRDLGELNNFYREVNETKNQNPEDFFIFVADETPNYAKSNSKPRNKTITSNEDDDLFEML